jgi:hypothetical protein
MVDVRHSPFLSCHPLGDILISLTWAASGLPGISYPPLLSASSYLHYSSLLYADLMTNFIDCLTPPCALYGSNTRLLSLHTIPMALKTSSWYLQVYGIQVPVFLSHIIYLNHQYHRIPSSTQNIYTFLKPTCTSSPDHQQYPGQGPRLLLILSSTMLLLQALLLLSKSSLKIC